MSRPRLLFVSPRFLFPIDSGGKIRTTGILREMKGGRYDITLLSPEPEDGRDHTSSLQGIADRWAFWTPVRGIARRMRRALHLFHPLPLPVASDLSASADALIARELPRHDVVVFDFIHAAALAPEPIGTPSVMFTHNVEAQIFERHAKVNTHPVMRRIWSAQWRKMKAFEGRSLKRFDRVVAVSDLDRDGFVDHYGADNVETIPTGVDLGFFPYKPMPEPGRVVFTGSMDWMANQDAIEFFLSDIWPLVRARRDDATMSVVGRAPPERLQARANGVPGFEFTGFVDDVRDYIHRAGVYAIPLRVGGGTRLKVFEAMASGCPVVSTAIGVEGLGLEDGVHYLNAESPEAFAEATCRVLDDPTLARSIAGAARQYVEENASNAIVARRFEQICDNALGATANPTTGLASTGTSR
ncbi:MAG: glycosyltransferase family 4 protein [Pseudomonadota bacterium]